MSHKLEANPNAATSDADDVIAFLSDPASHGPTVDSVIRIDTHGAIVFLAGDRAYKIKRAVRLPYLDYSTLQRRARFCHREVERNKETAPDIYIAAVPIVRDADERLAIGGDGRVVEWAVAMQRFDDAALFDDMAERGVLPVETMTALADRIAAYHAGAQRRQPSNFEAALSGVIATISAAATLHADTLGSVRIKACSNAMVRALDANAPLLRQRSNQGFVRICHGDMHLKNIILHNGEPTLIDAIEFDDGIATIDVLYDLAFLLMDLWRQGLKRHANVVLNRYLQTTATTENSAALSALPLFLALRAGVRMMVAFDRAAQTAGQEREVTLKDAQAYFDLALGFLAPAQRRVIAVGGLSGTGKSSLAASLAPFVGPSPGAVHLRSDVERKQMFSVPQSTQLGSHGYTASATEQVYRRILRKAETVLAAGHAVVIDAVFLLPDQRGQAEQVAQKAGVPFAGIWLEAAGDVLVERVEARRGDASDADAEIVRRQLDIPSGDIDWQVVDATADRAAVTRSAAELLHIQTD